MPTLCVEPVELHG